MVTKENSGKRLLDDVNFPADLKKLSVDQLPQLAEEIREDLIALAAKKGGHFGATMGVVELTIALHYVFNTPEDKVIWDVGHQAYAHKMLTGRKEKISSIRQYQGLAPFCRRSESDYDTFGAGHASTSIGAGVGIAEGFRLSGKPHKVIPVIGDGSMTGGVAYEGLNMSGFTDLNMMVIFNENSMSIDPNVGALFNFCSSLLSRKMVSPTLQNLREKVKAVLGGVPHGQDLIKAVQNAEDKLMGLLAPGMIFETLGYFYVGPISGYDFPKMVETFENVKKMHRPVLVHVQTTKGKGYAPAEADPLYFHGPAPFDIATGKPIPVTKVSPPAYTSVFSNAICKIAETNPKVYGITAAMPTGAGLKKFGEKFPERYRDVGIAEQAAVLLAAGLATEGYLPVCAIYSTFLQRGYDQIIHDICLQNLPTVFVMDRAGIVGNDGPTHHGVFDFAYLRCIPGMVVMAPRDENELQHMLKTAIESKLPVGLRYPRGNGLGVALDSELKTLPIGKAEMMVDHVAPTAAMIAIGCMVHPSVAVAEKLEKEHGMKVSVVNARYVKPIDEDMIVRVARSTKHIITLEEAMGQGGFGSAVLEVLAKHQITDVKVKVIAIDDVWVEHGGQPELRRDHGLDEAGILKTVLEFLPKSQTARPQASQVASA